MKSLSHVLIFVGLMSLWTGARASSVLPVSTPELVNVSDAVFRGTVVGAACFRDADGLIYTRTSLRVDESLKGTFPPFVQVTHRGGRIGNEDEFYGLSPRFASGAEYLLFVVRDRRGRLQCSRGQASAVRLDTGSPYSGQLLAAVRQLTQNGQIPGADVTDQAGQAETTPDALTGMLGGIPSRYILPDRGEPILYLVDADSLPTGISLTQATNAIQQALNAWLAVTSLRFKFEGFQSFGQGADTVAIDDGKFRIQLHDNYNSITGPNVLGIGGRDSSSSALGGGIGWDIGGNVAGTEFWRSTRGFVVLKASHSAMETLTTFTEVLCHEIGHALNMAHSSENPNEANTTLKEAIMYFQAHEDGRGATLGSYDPPIIRQIYPTNSPPFFVHPFNRFMDVTTAPSTPSVTGINEIDLSRSDLQGSATLVLTNVTSNNGAFSTPGSMVRFTPGGYVNGPKYDPAGGFSYDRLVARVSDGTNASPYVSIRVMSLNPDSVTPSDGIPDSWMISYFANADPAVGTNHRSTNDFDGDTINNLNEYRSGMNPTNKNSAQRITLFTGSTIQWQARPYELYDIQGSSNLTTWTTVLTVMPTNATIDIRTNVLATNIVAVVSNLSTAGPRMFYRVQRVP